MREREQERKKNLFEEKEEGRRGAGKWLAVLAAGRERVGIKEEKEKEKGLVGGIVYVMEGQRATFASRLPTVSLLVGGGRKMACRSVTESCFSTGKTR